MNQDRENITGDLLKNSLLAIPDEDFTDRVMEKVLLEAKHKRSVLSSLSQAWIFMILSLVLVPFGLPVLVDSIHSISILSFSLPIPDPASLSIILSALFAVLILLLLSGLIRVTLQYRQQ